MIAATMPTISAIPVVSEPTPPLRRDPSRPPAAGAGVVPAAAAGEAGGRPVRRRDSAGRADTLSAAQSADDGRSGSQSDVDDVLSDCRITGRLQPVNQSVSP